MAAGTNLLRYRCRVAVGFAALLSASTAAAGEENIRPNPGFVGDPTVLSPPIVQAPLYACTTAVVVSGFVEGSIITVYVNGAQVSQVTGTSPSGQTIPVPALVAADVVSAEQYLKTYTSKRSKSVTVKKYLDDYPNGPPQPRLHAPLYECGISTSVRSLVAGSSVSVYSASQRSPGSFDPEVQIGKAANAGASGQALKVSPSFIRDARITAEYEICTDLSPRSPAEFVQPEPPSIPAPTIEPAIVGQKKVVVRNGLNGALIKVFAGGQLLGQAGGSSNGNVVGLSRNVGSGEVLTATQELCSGAGPGSSITVQECSSLSAPVVRHPEVGEDFIDVISAQPGARILVFDGSGREIGDGSGARVALTRRLVAADEVWVVQRIEDCESGTAYFVTVTCKTVDKVQQPQPNPSFGVGSRDYEVAKQRLGTRLVRMIGHVVFPIDPNQGDRLAPFGGPFPFIVILHGRHGVTRTENGDVCDGELEGPFIKEVQNHLGYTYLQESLARQGIVSVSILANDLACEAGDGPFIDERAELIVRHLEQWEQFGDPAIPDPVFSGMFHDRLDLQRVAFAGHSRGGEAAVVAVGISSRTRSAVQSVISVAPTDINRHRMTSGSLLVLLPAADGDVVTNSGAAIYDRARATQAGNWFKSQQYIYGANHNFFHREWHSDDCLDHSLCKSAIGRITRADQERMLSVWGTAFSLDTLTGRNYRAALAGDEVFHGVNVSTVLPSFEQEGALVIDDYEGGNGPLTNSLGRPVSQMGSSWINFDEGSLTGSIFSVLTTFRHATRGLIMKWRAGNDALFSSNLLPSNAEPFRYLSFRAAQTFDGTNYAARTYADVTVSLSDAQGVRTEVPLGDVSTLPFPYENQADLKAMLHTVRMPLSCFVSAEGEFRLDLLTELSMSFRSTAEPGGAIVLDDFAFTN